MSPVLCRPSTALPLSLSRHRVVARPPEPAVSNNSCSFAASSDQSVRVLLKARAGPSLHRRMVWSCSARMRCVTVPTAGAEGALRPHRHSTQDIMPTTCPLGRHCQAFGPGRTL
uniref:Uncharacterized protein n=1 Tax=Chromera velia CCMP2878 TaxID=1169474 RepID=A0A0G4HHE0_9ALVE|eukprot:Cvel_27584.t1-p1 / transcript=Cvel_27584.t1 / gene=Cvel_27584 / organism=Chromera_velia_CCMP2878 / gene_product=hypothetical protein / transcript_product=hypothetical protein / location=Cvel_scaffold3470:6401-8087(+) / protein_length=113 / sequence_SO=supercontig / SO=protein_coding / is_pseudo=false